MKVEGWRACGLATPLMVFSVFTFLSCRPQNPPFRGAVIHTVQVAPPIALSDHTGKSFTLEQCKGEVVLIFFGFTHCPDVCPMTMTKLQKVSAGLMQDDRVRVLFITVDPDRDRSQAIRDYIGNYSNKFVGLRGTQDELDAVYEAYGVYRGIDDDSNQAADNYTINHTNSVFVVDRKGNWRLNFTDTAKIDDIIHDVRILLRE